MTMIAFHTLFPEQAKNECRTVTLLNNDTSTEREQWRSGDGASIV